MASVIKIAKLLQERFNNGEYPNGKYPSLREIAAEMSCSYMTAFRAMHYLQDHHEPHTETRVFPLVAMITPFWQFSSWHRAIRESTMELGGLVRFVHYSSSIDPLITQTINDKFDLVLLDCPVEPGTPLFKIVQKNRDRVIVLFQDLTQYGIRCMDGIPEETIIMIMKDLAKYNIRHIDMIGHDEIDMFSARRQIWKKGLQQINGKGECFRYSHESFNEESVECFLYMKKHFDKQNLPEAFFCTGCACAQGIYRFLYDLNLVPGKDISIFSFGNLKISEMMAPPLATTVNAGLKEMVRKVISEYAQKKFSSTKMFKLTEQVYYKGDSLVPPQLKDTDSKMMKEEK